MGGIPAEELGTPELKLRTGKSPGFAYGRRMNRPTNPAESGGGEERNCIGNVKRRSRALQQLG